MSAFKITYALAVDGSDAKLPGFETAAEAAGQAALLATRGATSVLLMVEGPDERVSFTPLAVISPFVAPEEASHEQH